MNTSAYDRFTGDDGAADAPAVNPQERALWWQAYLAAIGGGRPHLPLPAAPNPPAGSSSARLAGVLPTALQRRLRAPDRRVETGVDFSQL